MDSNRTATTLEALCWPDLTFDRARVVELGARAECWTPEGDLWEYDGGVFYVTRLGTAIRHQPVAELSRVIDGPWSHAPDCKCPACRVATPVMSA